VKCADWIAAVVDAPSGYGLAYHAAIKLFP